MCAGMGTHPTFHARIQWMRVRQQLTQGAGGDKGYRLKRGWNRYERELCHACASNPLCRWPQLCQEGRTPIEMNYWLDFENIA